MPHFLRYEGGQIAIDGDRATAADWYSRQLRMTVIVDSEADGQTLLRFPQQHAIPIVSTGGGLRGTLWGSFGGVPVRDANVRLTLTAPNVPRTRDALVAAGVRVGVVGVGPGGLETFDFWDLEGTRLTAIEVPKQALAEHRGRFSGYGPLRVGVRELSRAIEWYGRVIGTTVLQEHQELGRALLDLGGFLPIWLEVLPAARFTGNQVAYARPHLRTADIEAAHAFCAAHELSPSPILGATGDLRLFHFFDPDGNAIGVWAY